MINIAVPLYRYELFDAVVESVVEHACPYFPIKLWTIEDPDKQKQLAIPYHENLTHISLVRDDNRPDLYGYHKRNKFLEICDDGFIYFLDDDNAIHPELFKNIKGLDEGYSVIMNQYHKNGELRLKFDSPVIIGTVDIGSILINRKDIDDLRFDDSYTADGVMFVHIFRTRETPVRRDPNPKTYYNKLR